MSNLVFALTHALTAAPKFFARAYDPGFVYPKGFSRWFPGANYPPPPFLDAGSLIDTDETVVWILMNMHCLWWLLKDVGYNLNTMERGFPEGTDLSSIQGAADILRDYLDPCAGKLSSVPTLQHRLTTQIFSSFWCEHLGSNTFCDCFAHGA